MQQQIWKFKLNIETTPNTIAMPSGAKILSVQAQDGEPVLWALCDPEAKKANRTFVIVGTGHLVPENAGQYIGTFQLPEYVFVGHVFEVGGKGTAKDSREGT